MKHQIFSRALSMTAAAALTCSAVFGGGGLTSAFAVQMPDEKPLLSQLQNADNTPVSVVIKVRGDAVMAQPEARETGADFLETAAAAQVKADCEAVQCSVQNSIRQLYPELRVRFSYSTLFNGFSCELPECLIEQVRALPDVLSVTKAETIQVPQMDRAAALSGLPAYYDMTGCTGEGQVIAVIDSELNISHPMFAPLADGITTAVSKEDIAEIAGSGTLNVSVDPDRAYISNKLPYVVDYLDEDLYGAVTDPESYHGTHVSGIAAGNAFKADDGTELSGIARDAQLMFFACGRGMSIGLEEAIAATEDAIRLHADVINMSWGTIGEYFGENPLQDVISAAENAGIVICAAAGNDDNGTRSLERTVTPENPDCGMISDKAELGSPVMLVASADNTRRSEAGTFVFNGQTIVFRPTMNSFGSVCYLSDELELGEYEYVNCGYGSAEECRELDLSGKIMLVQRGKVNFEWIASTAAEAGAVGVILIDKEYTDGLEYARSDMKPPIAVITYSEGQEMLAAENKTVTFTGEKVMRDYPTQVSSYTSWGVKQSLDLRPDIMGIGGRVRSAGYEGSDSTLSGTSMASPYLAGCTAVIREYVRQQNPELSGAALSSYIRRLLMNTAVPYEENGLFVTPRRQGAGLVSPDRAAAAKVLMTGTSGDAKLNLYDRLGQSFSFSFTVTNSSPEDVTFPAAEIRLTTDGIVYDKTQECNVLTGQQALSSTSSLAGPVTVAAGQSETLTVQVDLDAAQYTQLKKSFINGFFIEGYLMLSGAENSADISIPMLGFSDDWAQYPVLDPDTLSAGVQFGNVVYPAGLSLVDTELLLQQIRQRVPEDAGALNIVNLEDYMTDEEKKKLEFGTNEVWISPKNNDSIADLCFGTSMHLTRTAKFSQQLLDPDGNVLVTHQNNTVCPYYLPSGSKNSLIEIDPREVDWAGLDDGLYTLSAKARIDYPGSAEAPQEYTAKIHVDNNAPEVHYSYVEENGRVILRISAEDDQQLQGIVVTGIGSGGLAETYDPDQADPDAWGFFPSKAISMRSSLLENGMTESLGNDTTALPYILRKLGLLSDMSEGTAFNFTDAVPTYVNEFGLSVIEYDVTDLRNYSFVVLDQAYNYVEIRSVENSAVEFVKKMGVWEDQKDGLYETTGDKIIYTSFFDGSVKEYSYTAKKNKLTLTCGSETREAEVIFLSPDSFRLDFKDGSDQHAMLKLINPLEMKHITDRPFHPVNELILLAQADSAAYWEVPVGETWTEIYFGGPHTLTVRTFFGENEYGYIWEDLYLDLYTGRGSSCYWEPTDPSGAFGHFFVRPINLYKQCIETIPAGLYGVTRMNVMMLFNDDGKTGKILYRSTFSEVGYMEGDTPFTYTIGEEGEVEFVIDGKTLTGKLFVDERPQDIYAMWDYGDPDDEEYNYNDTLIGYESSFKLITSDPDQIASLRTDEELRALAIAYEEAACGFEINDRDCELSSGDTYLSMSFLDGDFSDGFTFDPLTLKGENRFGKEIDLLNPPEYPENGYSFDEITETVKAYVTELKGAEPTETERYLQQNGTVIVNFWWEYQNEGEYYLVDPISGFCANMAGEAVNLFPSKGYMRGDVNCDGARDVADAVLLARYLAEDRGAEVSDTGKKNADCNVSGLPDQDDITMILKAIARLIRM